MWIVMSASRAPEHVTFRTICQGGGGEKASRRLTQKFGTDFQPTDSAGPINDSNGRSKSTTDH